MTNESRTRWIAALLCLIPAAYFLLVAGYALFYHDDFASDLPRILRYVLGPLTIALLLAACARLSKVDSALMIGITACSVLAGLFAFEAYMTWRALPDQVGLAGVVDEGTDLESYGGSMPPAYTIKALNNELGTKRLSEAYLSGIPDAETLLCSQSGVPVVTRHDSYGFRNPTRETAAPVDIMVLGDSFAEGICLADGEGFVDQMRAGGASILNTASRGAGPLYELAVFGRYGPHFKPKITIIAFFEGNDWENLESEAKKPWLLEAFEPDADFGSIDVSHARLDQATEIIDGWWQGSAVTIDEYLSRRAYLRNFFALHQTASTLGIHYPKAAAENPIFGKVLDRAKAIAGTWDGRVVVVYIPSLNRYGGLFRHDFVTEPIRSEVAAATADAGLDFIDLASAFRSHGKPTELFAPDSHLSQEGAAFAASTIMADPAIDLPIKE